MADMTPFRELRVKAIRAQLDALQQKIEKRGGKPTKAQANEVLALMACLAVVRGLFPAFEGVPDTIRIAFAQGYAERAALPAEGV